MAKQTIIWSERAQQELREVLSYYANRNGNIHYSSKLLSRIKSFENLLGQNKYLGRLTENKRTRVLVMDVYLIFYEFSKHHIEILSFWDNRQNPKYRIDNF